MSRLPFLFLSGYYRKVCSNINIQEFLETGSVGDHTHTRRPSTIIEGKVQELQQISGNESVNNVRSVAREANISSYQAHQIMRDFIEYKSYMVQCSTMIWWKHALRSGNVGTQEKDLIIRWFSGKMTCHPIFPKKLVHGAVKNLMEVRLAQVIQFLGQFALSIWCHLIFFPTGIH